MANNPTPTVLPTAAERVAAGAAWLDKNEPGWVGRVNPEYLDLSSCFRCIGGQLLPDYIGNRYMQWRDQHGLSHEEAIRLGFIRPVFSNEEYDLLTEAWRDEITARRDREVAPDAR